MSEEKVGSVLKKKNDAGDTIAFANSENAATISNTNVVRGSNGFHVLNHTTSVVEPIFARGRFAGNNTNGNANQGEHNAICVIKN